MQDQEAFRIPIRQFWRTKGHPRLNAYRGIYFQGPAALLDLA